MDEKQITTAITTAFGSNVDGFTKAMVRLAKQDELIGLQSKFRNVQAEADKNASSYVAALEELSAMIAALQKEIDGLEEEA
jgi:hypothetical protein